MTAALLRTTRRALSLTQEELGDRVGVTGSAVGQYELGKLPVPSDVVRTVLRITGRVGTPCPKCSTTVTVEFVGGTCGRCHIDALRRGDLQPRKRPAAPSSPPATHVGPSRDVSGPPEGKETP